MKLLNNLVYNLHTFVELCRKFTLKKYCYLINHKRLGLNYFYFSLVTALAGSILATAIRFEMAYPGSSFFNGDSLRYLQVITAHALIMIFFVVVPIFFGGFANFLLPYHVGSKDVAFPRLNSLGFWIQPCGFLLIAKIGFLRTEFWQTNDKISNYFQILETSKGFNPLLIHENSSFISSVDTSFTSFFQKNKKVIDVLPEVVESLKKEDGKDDLGITFSNNIAKLKNYISNNYHLLGFSEDNENYLKMTWKLLYWKYLYIMPETFWYLVQNAHTSKRRKRYIVKCASSTQTVAGWTFITPFSSKLKFTGVGIQDMLILGVYFAGISTTISLVNLLATRRCLAMPGLRNRRILVSFVSISILLMFRALAVITPVLGSAMLMLALDRHWNTSFFDFAYGGDPIFFHHLFWFFGHPEVYVLVIPAFGVVNAVLPTINMRRVASKHHLIWAIYIMNYMGFLVWGHHMYLIGLDHRSRSLYSTITIMISMPATIKVVNWTFTLMNGSLRKDTVLMAIISFILFFLVAGLTGMWLSHVSLNISMHDTLYVVAHFHLMLAGTVFMGIFVGFYFYFTSFFQVKYSRTLSFVHILYYSGGVWMTFIPLFWVSFSGLPRRLHDYPAMYMGWQSMATVGHLVTMVGVISFYAMLFESHLEKKVTTFLYHIIARFNKRILYYIYKYLYIHVLNNSIGIVPTMYSQLYLSIRRCKLSFSL